MNTPKFALEQLQSKVAGSIIGKEVSALKSSIINGANKANTAINKNGISTMLVSKLQKVYESIKGSSKMIFLNFVKFYTLTKSEYHKAFGSVIDDNSNIIIKAIKLYIKTVVAVWKAGGHAVLKVYNSFKTMTSFLINKFKQMVQKFSSAQYIAEQQSVPGGAPAPNAIRRQSTNKKLSTPNKNQKTLKISMLNKKEVKNIFIGLGLVILGIGVINVQNGNFMIMDKLEEKELILEGEMTSRILDFTFRPITKLIQSNIKFVSNVFSNVEDLLKDWVKAAGALCVFAGIYLAINSAWKLYKA